LPKKDIYEPEGRFGTCSNLNTTFAILQSSETWALSLIEKK